VKFSFIWRNTVSPWRCVLPCLLCATVFSDRTSVSVAALTPTSSNKCCPCTCTSYRIVIHPSHDTTRRTACRSCGSNRSTRWFQRCTSVLTKCTSSSSIAGVVIPEYMMIAASPFAYTCLLQKKQGLLGISPSSETDDEDEPVSRCASQKIMQTMQFQDHCRLLTPIGGGASGSSPHSGLPHVASPHSSSLSSHFFARYSCPRPRGPRSHRGCLERGVPLR